MNGAPELVIDVKDLRKSFGDRPVVQGLTMQVAKGEIFGFLGPNGSGKTTTIRMLCGLLQPDGGSGTCLGLDILREAPRIRRSVGYMTQKFSYYEDLTVFENLRFVASVYEMKNAGEAVRGIMERMGLADRANQLAGQLSGGWKHAWLARSPPASCTSRSCCCSTNPPPGSTPRRGGSSGTCSTTWPARA